MAALPKSIMALPMEVQKLDAKVCRGCSMAACRLLIVWWDLLAAGSVVTGSYR